MCCSPRSNKGKPRGPGIQQVISTLVLLSYLSHKKHFVKCREYQVKTQYSYIHCAICKFVCLNMKMSLICLDKGEMRKINVINFNPYSSLETL